MAMAEISWRILRGFNGETFETGPNMPQTGSMDLGKAEGQLDPVNRDMYHKGVGRTNHNNQVATNRASVLGGAYYTAMQTQNHYTAQVACEHALKALEGRVELFLTPDIKGVLVIAVFTIAGPARSFKHALIHGPARSAAEALKRYDDRGGSIGAENSRVQLYWGHGDYDGQAMNQLMWDTLGR